MGRFNQRSFLDDKLNPVFNQEQHFITLNLSELALNSKPIHTLTNVSEFLNKNFSLI